MIILPSTYINSPRHMTQLYQDSMAIVRDLGPPDLFVTVTCNPNWIEITRELLPYQGKYIKNKNYRKIVACDRPDLCSRVYNMQLKCILNDLMEKNILGKVVGKIHVIEFQKRGLPHAHILLILHSTDKPRSFDDYDKLGFLQDDNEWEQCLQEASLVQSGEQLRFLFSTILLFFEPSDPGRLWILFKRFLSDDYFLKFHSEAVAENYALIDIQKLLDEHNKKICDYNEIPIPIIDNHDYFNKLIRSELNFDINLLKIAHESDLKKLNDDQTKSYDLFMKAIYDKRYIGEKAFFIDGPGGCGTTFLYKTLLGGVRIKSDIAIATASSGIASLLLSNGRTAHSRFKIPINPHESSTCNIKQRSELSELIKVLKLIICDEAPMAHKFCVESVDRSLRDITDLDLPFGDKVIVCGGDFRQVLQVVRN